MPSPRRIALFAGAILYVAAGTLHFLRPDSYAKIIPPFIPYPLAMVYISGLAEIAGGIGLLIPRVRRAAAWGLIALLISVFPANIYMAVAHVPVTEHPIATWLLWGRLPLQLLLIWWVLWCSKDPT